MKNICYYLIVARKVEEFTYEECVRDKLDDRTATCKCKVLKLERWVLKMIEIPSKSMGFLSLKRSLFKRLIKQSLRLQ